MKDIIATFHPRPRVAVHKFASCDGCQLAFLNGGESLLTLASLVEIVHFAEVGVLAPDAEADIAFVEGSIAADKDLQRIQDIRARSRYLVTIGACATAGGLQALRNISDSDGWLGAVYAKPEYLDSLATCTPIAGHVKVDLELWGCPVNGRQVLGAIRSLLSGVVPLDDQDKLCLECKRRGNVCTLVSGGAACLGPVTRTGCGALCPSFGRDCYGCYGPAENSNADALGRRFEGLGLLPEEIARRFLFINSGAPELQEVGLRWRDGKHE
ncbi:MAG: sulfhydrogenase subunit delta [Gammaproteobacteria bacterium]